MKYKEYKEVVVTNYRNIIKISELNGEIEKLKDILTHFDELEMETKSYKTKMEDLQSRGVLNEHFEEHISL